MQQGQQRPRTATSIASSGSGSGSGSNRLDTPHWYSTAHPVTDEAPAVGIDPPGHGYRELSPAQKRIVDRIIRIDQAGELGANYIYKGQLAVFKNDPKVGPLIQAMWDGEKKHLKTFNRMVATYRVRPTILFPLWKAAAWTLGAGTAMMGKEAAMACTEAVETSIGEHYNDQLRQLSSFESTPDIEHLRAIIKEFRDDELGHLDTAVEHDAQKAPAHALLSAVIAQGCKGAIFLSQRI